MPLLGLICACGATPNADPSSRRLQELRALYPILVTDADLESPASAPLKSGAAITLLDPASGATITFVRNSVTDVDARTVDGIALFPAAGPDGGDVVAIPRLDGIEDFVVVNQPSVASLDYTVDVTGIAGLRLVGGVLEMLDASGAPRLRVAPPFVVAADQSHHAASLAVPDCALSRDPAPPWGRPVVAPLAARCTVRVAWDPHNLRYPVLVDPNWTTTGNMPSPRQDHIAVLLVDGRVLVAGGSGSTGTTATAAIYDPTTATWAATASLATARRAGAAVLLADGRVLMAGGTTVSASLASAEIYDPIAGSWTPTGSLLESRMNFTATLLENGMVLAVAGDFAPFSFGCGTRSSAELWNPSTGVWSGTGGVGGVFGHTATRLEDGSVLVAGGSIRTFNGVFCVDSVIATASIYAPAMGSFQATGSLGQARALHTATRLVSGRVLVAGGGLASAELYDLQTKTWAPTANSMSASHTQHQAVRLGNGRVLVADGASTDEYDPVANTWSPVTPLLVSRQRPSLTLLPTGRVLAAGGNASGSPSTSAELYDPGDTSCGDGAIQAAESCDGSNLGGKSCQSIGFSSGTLGCSPACTLDTSLCSRCGDGTINPGEECDDGNSDDTDACLASCRSASCGDGVVHAGVEQCDGMNVAGQTCTGLGFAGGTLNCTAGCAFDSSACWRCGNGTVDPGEQCDDANSNDTDACLSSCQLAFCGDGHVRAGIEECDDAGDPGPACDDTCHLPTICTLDPPIPPTPPVAAEPNIDFAKTIRSGFFDVTFHVETSVSAGGPSSTEVCTFDLTSSNKSGELCAEWFSVEYCLGVSVSDSGSITMPATCSSPPQFTCDSAQRCQRHATIWELELSKSFVGDVEIGPASCSTSVGVAGFGSISRTREDGPGCPAETCPGGIDRFSGQVGLRGIAEAGCQVRVGGFLTQAVTGSFELCESVLLEETSHCGAVLTPTITAGARVKLPDVTVGWLKIHGFEREFPEGGGQCLSN